MGGKPSNGAESDDDQQRRRPDHHFQLGGVMPFRIVYRVLVSRTVTPGENQRQCYDRHDDQEHQHRRHDDQVTLLKRHIARRVQNDGVTAGKDASENHYSKSS
jgi:hypothetical protein